MAGAGCVRSFRSEIARRARSDATRRGRRGYFARRARSDAGPVRTSCAPSLCCRVFARSVLIGRRTRTLRRRNRAARVRDAFREA